MNQPIGVFDSGVGGISVLGRAIQALPGENFIYYADTANFPYGDKEPEIIKAGLVEAAAAMVAGNVKAMVVACNTATSVAIEEIRSLYSFPILGIEPALKPAVTKAQGKRVAVIATALTLRESKFHHLLAQCRDAGDIVNLPAPGLADLVENDHYNDEVAREFLNRLFKDVGPVDAIVLGCTHYLFLAPLLKERFPEAELIDGGEGTVRHLCRVLGERGMLSAEGTGDIQVLSSDPKSFFPKFQSHLDYITEVLNNLK